MSSNNDDINVFNVWAQGITVKSCHNIVRPPLAVSSITDMSNVITSSDVNRQKQHAPTKSLQGLAYHFRSFGLLRDNFAEWMFHKK